MAHYAFHLLIFIGYGFMLSEAQNLDYTFGSTRVRFLGKSPNFQIYPNTNLTSYLQLRFSKFEERDVNLQKVQGHSITSLASADPSWTAGNLTKSDGTNLTYVKMVLDPINQGSFSYSCPTSSGGNGNGNGRRLLSDFGTRRLLLASNITVTVTVFFGLDQNTTFQYGYNKTISVSKGGLKFSVEYANWPFCNDSNTLGMEIDLLLKGNATTQASVSTASDGIKKLAMSLGDNVTSEIAFANYAYEAYNGTRTLPVNVSLDTSGTTSTVTLRLPNPKPNASVFYDPTVTTSEVVGSAAAGLHVSLWIAGVAVLLSALLLA